MFLLCEYDEFVYEMCDELVSMKHKDIHKRIVD